MANASRDSSDMVVRSLKHCNYARALELEHFSDKCRNSSQLLLSKTELPLLELTESRHDFESAFDYFDVSIKCISFVLPKTLFAPHTLYIMFIEIYECGRQRSNSVFPSRRLPHFDS